MDEHYDYIVLGTGLTECILSGLLSNAGKKVLHMDRNKYYGGASASISPLSKLYEHFGREPAPKEKFGRDRDWNVDLVPKFLMADGQLVQLLIHTGVTRYLEFKNIEGSYVIKGNKVHKVPCDEKEAMTSSLMGLLEKRRFRNLLIAAMKFDINDPKTYSGTLDNPRTDTIQKFYEKFGVDKNTQDFVGHSICLYTTEDYKVKETALDAINKIKLYHNSLIRYQKSPYVYPMYGLGELPQGFARLSAVYGGTYMLDKQVDGFAMEAGRVVGVKSGEETVTCGAVICDPSYAMDRVRQVGKVIRAICILRNPIPDTHGSLSCQIIIPQNQVGRKNDIYISCVSYSHCIASNNFYVALVATTVETSNPQAELRPGLDLLGNKEEIFFYETDLYEPIDDGRDSQIFISKSYDATTHFESTCQDVLDIYERVTGEKFDFAKLKVANLEDANSD